MLAARLAVPFLISGFLLLPGPGLFAGQSFLREADDNNVNRQYLIESVALAGVDVSEVADAKLTPSLRARLASLIGQHCDLAILDDLSGEIRRDLHLRAVTEHLLRGTEPGQIRVNFEIERKDVAFDVSLPKFLYHSQQGFTGEVDATAQLRRNTFTFGVVSNGDDLTERFSGVTARFDSEGLGSFLGSDRIHFGTTFEDYHEAWNPATVNAAETTGLDLYRSRRNVAPEFTFSATPDLTIAAGASFEATNSETAAVGERSSNAATFDVHYRRKIGGGAIQHQIEAKYSLRVATHMLGSTYAYARHLISMRYEARSGRHVISNEFMAGSIAGDAPFFDRFVLGSSSTLRGWNRYQIDPVGGDRVVHDEITYGHRMGEGTAEGFYDAGVLWNSDTGPANRAAKLRHSLGVGYKQGIFTLTMAFPVRNGRIEPVFMAGMNY